LEGRLDLLGRRDVSVSDLVEAFQDILQMVGINLARRANLRHVEQGLCDGILCLRRHTPDCCDGLFQKVGHSLLHPQ